MRFDFTCDWQEGPAEIRLSSHRSTWAHLTLGVDGRIFTSNAPLDSDDEDAGARDFIAVSVFPLAEFIAANWWALLHEPQEKKNLLADASAFNRRHWINRHTDGFAYPTLGIFGADTSVRIVARPSHIESANIEFPVSSGGANVHWEGVERDDVESVLLSFLAVTARRLPDNDDKTWLLDLLARITRARTDPEEAIYCHCAGLLGADPFEPGDELYTAITQTIGILGQDLAMEMFATAEAETVAYRAQWLQEQTHSVIGKSRAVAAHAGSLKHKLQAAKFMTGKPWERGYAAAQQLRRLIGMNPDMPLATADSVTRALFDAPATIVSSINNLEPNSGVRGVVSTNRDGMGIAMQGGRMTQFQIAATFSDFLFSGESELSLSTAASTDRQKTNRAFAAEFLAPVAGIKEQWSSKRMPEANFDNIAYQFGVSPSIVRYQVQNQAEYLLDQ